MMQTLYLHKEHHRAIVICNQFSSAVIATIWIASVVVEFNNEEDNVSIPPHPHPYKRPRNQQDMPQKLSC